MFSMRERFSVSDLQSIVWRFIGTWAWKRQKIIGWSLKMRQMFDQVNRWVDKLLFEYKLMLGQAKNVASLLLFSNHFQLTRGWTPRFQTRTHIPFLPLTSPSLLFSVFLPDSSELLCSATLLYYRYRQVTRTRCEWKWMVGKKKKRKEKALGRLWYQPWKISHLHAGFIFYGKYLESVETFMNFSHFKTSADNKQRRSNSVTRGNVHVVFNWLEYSKIKVKFTPLSYEYATTYCNLAQPCFSISSFYFCTLQFYPILTNDGGIQR